MDKETYDAHRQQLADALLQQSVQHDKAILTLASGAFAVSISFMRFVAPEPAEGTLTVLGIAWFLFAASISFVLSSFQISIWAHKREEEILNYVYSTGQEPIGKNAKNVAITATVWLNIFALMFFIAGLFFWASFAMQNLAKADDTDVRTKRPQSGPTSVANQDQPRRDNQGGGSGPSGEANKSNGATRSAVTAANQGVRKEWQRKPERGKFKSMAWFHPQDPFLFNIQRLKLHFRPHHAKKVVRCPITIDSRRVRCLRRDL